MSIVSYTKPTGQIDTHNAPIMEQKTVAVKDDLKITLGEMGSQDFFTYMPVRYIEDFFRQIQNDENADFRSYLNNFHTYFPGGYRQINRETLNELTDENTQRKLGLIDEIAALLLAYKMDTQVIIKEVQNLPQTEQNIRKFYRKVWPIYIALRNKGYSHNDLRS